MRECMQRSTRDHTHIGGFCLPLLVTPLEIDISQKLVVFATDLHPGNPSDDIESSLDGVMAMMLWRYACTYCLQGFHARRG